MQLAPPPTVVLSQTTNTESPTADDTSLLEMDIPPPAKPTLSLLPNRSSTRSSTGDWGVSTSPDPGMDSVGTPTTHASGQFVNAYVAASVGRNDSTFDDFPFDLDPLWMNFPSHNMYSNTIGEGQWRLPPNHLEFSRNSPSQRELQPSPNAYVAGLEAASLHFSDGEHHLSSSLTF
jgi:hypothetical protein